MKPDETDLEWRVRRLEARVAAIASRVGHAPDSAPSPVTRSPAPPPGVAPPSPSRHQNGSTLEMNLVGTWFARLGAVALVLGAGFGFKHAIDRGLVGPSLRVAIGVLAALLLLGWGERSRRRGWDPLAQSVTAGGIALLYLSVLAAAVLYDLIELPLALVMLTSIAMIGGALALRHDSIALAVLATLTGFLNAGLMASNAAEPGALYAYIVVLDLAVLGLAGFKRWRALNGTAFVGTWVLFAATVASASFGIALAFASIFFVVLSALPLFQSMSHGAGRSSDMAFVVSTGFAYVWFALELLEPALQQWQGVLTIVVALAYLLFGYTARKLAPRDRLLSLVMLAMSIAMVTLAVPLQLSGRFVPLAWSLEATMLAFIAVRTRAEAARWGSVALTVLSFGGGGGATAAALLTGFDAPQSPSFGSTAVQVGAFYCTGYLLAGREEKGWSAPTAAAAGVLANVLTLMWLSTRAAEYFAQLPGDNAPATQLALSAILAVYGAVLLAVGVTVRLQWVRLFAVVLFVLTTLKLLSVDVWLLSTSYRTFAFVGLGALLLLCSLTYNRFKEVVVGEQGRASPGTPSEGPSLLPEVEGRLLD